MLFSQKKMKGGTNLKKGLPPWATAPIARFIAYRKCCPKPNYEIKCDPNIYLYMFEELLPLTPFLILKSIVYVSGDPLGYIYYNPLYSCINPYMIKTFALISVYHTTFILNYVQVVLKVSKDFPMFNKLILNGPINFIFYRQNVHKITVNSDTIEYRWYKPPNFNILNSATAGKYILTFT